MQTNKKALVISDELFKGTNIHDAYEASKLVIHGFYTWANSIFLISFHCSIMIVARLTKESSYLNFKQIAWAKDLPWRCYWLVSPELAEYDSHLQRHRDEKDIDISWTNSNYGNGDEDGVWGDVLMNHFHIEIVNMS